MALEVEGPSLFLPPSRPETDPMEAGETPSSDPHDESLSPDEPAAGSGSAPRSTAARRRALLGVFKTAVVTVGGMAHALLTREGSMEREWEVFVPDEDDVEAISTPLASLASRRAPSGVDNPDVTDLVQLAMGLFGYGIKQRQRLAAIAVQRSFTGGTADDTADAENGAQGAAQPA